MKEALQRALDALGPTPPDCCGCQTEWQIAIDAIKESLREHALGEVQRFGEEMEETGAAIKAEREACAKLLEEAAQAAKDVDPQGFVWIAIKTSAEGIRARGQA